jgi:hypothetical protein
MTGDKSPTPITDFLYRLEVDPGLVNQFFDNADGALAGSGMSEEARQALKDGDLQTLQRLVDQEHPDPVKLLIRGWIR